MIFISSTFLLDCVWRNIAHNIDAVNKYIA